MAKDHMTAATRRRSGADCLAKKAARPHPAILALARLIGRQMAREHHAARRAANDNRPADQANAASPGDSAGPGIPDTS
jgi:hypothetical protein